MERPSYVNPTEVSCYWTPDHLDVTDLPVRYAAPKAAWIDGLARMRPLVKIDADDRMARRRMQTHAIVDPNEITALPVLEPLPVRRERPATWRWFDEMRVPFARRRTTG